MLAISLAILLLVAGPPAPSGGGFGHVEFANSGAPAAQADFLQGMALLHDFEYGSAADAFRRAEAADPGFAMAYWGEAMTFNHPIWMQQDLKGARAALAKLAPTAPERRARAGTDREKGYLDAIEILYGEGSKESRDLKYEEAMAGLHRKYPGDVDAAAFYGLSILGTAHAGRDVSTYMRAAGGLEEAWMDHHEHPGLLHYLIHSYDDPVHAPLGLRAARIYARVAPDAAHAQHMTSHIFLALGMWPETVEANIAAIADVDRARKSKGEIPLGCGHYPSWLEYAYLQLGQADRALEILGKCKTELEESSDGKGDHSMDPDHSLTGSFASMRLWYLVNSGDWGGEVALWTLPVKVGPGARLDFAFARALGQIARGDGPGAHRAMKDLEAAAGEAEEITAKQGDPNPTYHVRPRILVLEARGLLSELEGDLAGAEKLLRQAIDVEKALPVTYGPPVIDKPTHELLGEFLLRHGRKKEARAEFQEALARAPGRRLALQGLRESSAGPAAAP